MKHDLISIRDLARGEITEFFALAADLKQRLKQKKAHPLLPGKTLALIFEKPSLRTRVTFEVAMTHLGGHATYLAPQDIRLGERETVEDGARNLSRWVDGIVARTFDHAQVERLAQYASVPVINGLSGLLHPCQVLGDLYTLQEKRGRLDGLRVGFIGDGNNVCNSWLYGAAKMGIHLVVACPKGYEPHRDVFTKARAEAEATQARIEIIHDPIRAAKGADVLYTDVWTSMGHEEHRAKRMRDFQGFQVSQALVEVAQRDVMVMHCLPAHRGEEITDEVMDGPHSIILDQAENRLHVQKAILVTYLGTERSEQPARHRWFFPKISLGRWVLPRP
ncbi:MAG: ornithine carbamoyltransferase [candidate division NC10 bacterium]|nr:ornithine carbamoyltransferase [candidate division NC10 bacterium]MCZ6551344.1 ornithine carbamoyltransferase [candidate division NC10 bacterium]